MNTATLQLESPDVGTASPPGAAGPTEYGPLNPQPHPFLPGPSRAEIDAAMSSPEAAAQYLEWFKRRETLISRSEQPGQLIKYAFELECWHDFDRDLAEAKTDGRDYGGLYIGGGKRSTKSSKATCTTLKSALTYGGGIIWCMQREMPISRVTMQRMVWEWLPQSIREKNDVSGKRKGNDPTKVRYTLDGGFTEGILVLPNGTMLMFINYNLDPKNYQGAEIGARIHPRTTAKAGEWPWIARVDGAGVAYDHRGLPIPNIGAWLDEDASLSWVNTVRDRLTTRNAKFIWTFTTENGITRAVKQTLGEAQNIETRAADDMLPQNRVLVRGCPPGHVPYRQKTATPGVNAIFFHTRFNVFGDSYRNMAAKYRGKDESQVLANIYGYSEDMARRAYPLYGGWNVIEEEDLPAEGTNYLFGDPAGSRAWFWLWIRVAPGYGGQEDWYIYNEWPDAHRYGAWAEPDESQEPNPDGIRGPAQRTLGWGVEKYKEMILEQERIIVPPDFIRQDLQDEQDFSGSATDDQGSSMAPASATRAAEKKSALPDSLKDPMKLKLIQQHIEENGDSRRSSLQLPVRERYLDPRAAATPKEQQKGAKTLLDLFREETKAADGTITHPRMMFRPAPGLDIQVGISAVQRLLYFDDKSPLVRGLNAPRLFVARKCRQVQWMFENYTGDGGESGGCKDPADLVRYAATSRLRYIAPGMTKTTGGGRSY